MPETPNHGYNVPNEGEQDWHEPLNENFEQYDTDIEIRDQESNGGNYEPKAGAKFLATDTGNVYVGDGSSWNHVPSTGPDPNLQSVDVESRGTFGGVTTDNLGVGAFPADRARILAEKESGDGAAVDATTSSDDNGATAVDAEASSSAGNTFGVRAVCRSPDGHGVFGVNYADGGSAIGVEGGSNSPNGIGVKATNTDGLALRAEGESEFDGDVTMTNDGTMNIWWDAGTDDYIRTYVDMQEKEFNWTFNDTSMGLSSGGEFVVGADAYVYGSFEATGTKNFVQAVDTDDGEREVVYTATEAGTPHTEATGVAELEDGRATVGLPDHFGWVTDGDEPLAVQTTPYGGSAGLKVVERSTDRIVVEDLDGEGDYEFSYTVKGTRDGYADQEVVREPSASADHDGPAAPADD